MTQVHPDGIFAAELPGTVTDYRLDVDGARVDDPYRHLPTLGELDLHLIGEGRHEKLWTVLGAQPRGTGVSAFAVWAPSARGVQVIGDFAGWGPYDGWPMRSLGSSGVWELYVPGAQSGTKYKFKSSAGTASGASTPTRSPSTPRSRRPPRRWSSSPRTSGRTPTGWPQRAAKQPAPGADERVRGAPRLLAARVCPTSSWPTS